jgi:hypothetical protein
VDNNYLDLGMSKSGFIHTLPSGRLIAAAGDIGVREVSRTATYRTTATHRSATAWYDGILLKFTQRFLK